MHTTPQPTLLPPDDAFIRHLTECQSALRGYCHAALGHGEDAKDAWQRTNVVLWKKSGDWDPATKFLPWALAVARFEVLAVIRDKQRERLVFDADVLELMADDSISEAEGHPARRDALRQCMEKLKPEQRSILSAHYVDGDPLARIATARSMGLSAVKVLLLRLRRSLGECIDRQINLEARA